MKAKSFREGKSLNLEASSEFRGKVLSQFRKMRHFPELPQVLSSAPPEILTIANMALIQHSREADANESLPEYGGAIAPNRSAASDTGSYDYDAEYGGAITASNESAGLVEEQQQAGGRKMHLVRSLPSSSVWRTVKERAEFLEEIADFLDDYPSAYLPQREAVPEVRSLDNGQTLPFPTGIPDTEEIDTVSMSLPAIVYRGAEKEISRKLVNQDFRCFTPHQKKLTKPGADLFCDILVSTSRKECRLLPRTRT